MDVHACISVFDIYRRKEFSLIIQYYSIVYLEGYDNMGFSFHYRKKQKMGKLIGYYVNQRIQHKRAYEQELNRLDAQLQHEKIDKLERDRLRTILETEYYEQQQEDWKHIKKRIQ